MYLGSVGVFLQPWSQTVQLHLCFLSYRYCCISLKNLNYYVRSGKFTVASQGTSLRILKTASRHAKGNFLWHFHSKSIIKIYPFHHFNTSYLSFLLYIYSYSTTSSTLHLHFLFNSFWINFITSTPSFLTQSIFHLYLRISYSRASLIVSLLDSEILQGLLLLWSEPCELWSLLMFFTLSPSGIQKFTNPHTLDYFTDTYYWFCPNRKISIVLYLTGQCLQRFQTLALLSFSWCWQSLLCPHLSVPISFCEYLYRNTFKTCDVQPSYKLALITGPINICWNDEMQMNEYMSI